MKTRYDLALGYGSGGGFPVLRIMILQSSGINSNIKHFLPKNEP